MFTDWLTDQCLLFKKLQMALTHLTGNSTGDIEIVYKTENDELLFAKIAHDV